MTTPADENTYLELQVKKLTTELEEARAWVKRLTGEGRVLTCVYCGEAYPPGSPTHGAEVLTEHVRTCAKHPLRAAEKEAERLRAALAHTRTVALNGWTLARLAALDRGQHGAEHHANLQLDELKNPPAAYKLTP